MKRAELQSRASSVAGRLRELVSQLEFLEHGSTWDEDYKVEREERLNAQVFDELDATVDVVEHIASRMPYYS